jgi:hypothetical protein
MRILIKNEIELDDLVLNASGSNPRTIKKVARICVVPWLRVLCNGKAARGAMGETEYDAVVKRASDWGK